MAALFTIKMVKRKRLFEKTEREKHTRLNSTPHQTKSKLRNSIHTTLSFCLWINCSFTRPWQNLISKCKLFLYKNWYPLFLFINDLYFWIRWDSLTIEKRRWERRVEMVALEDTTHKPKGQVREPHPHRGVGHPPLHLLWLCSEEVRIWCFSPSKWRKILWLIWWCCWCCWWTRWYWFLRLPTLSPIKAFSSFLSLKTPPVSLLLFFFSLTSSAHYSAKNLFSPLVFYFFIFNHIIYYLLVKFIEYY